MSFKEWLIFNLDLAEHLHHCVILKSSGRNDVLDVREDFPPERWAHHSLYAAALRSGGTVGLAARRSADMGLQAECCDHLTDDEPDKATLTKSRLDLKKPNPEIWRLCGVKVLGP